MERKEERGDKEKVRGVRNKKVKEKKMDNEDERIIREQENETD